MKDTLQNSALCMLLKKLEHSDFITSNRCRDLRLLVLSILYCMLLKPSQELAFISGEQHKSGTRVNNR